MSANSPLPANSFSRDRAQVEKLVSASVRVPVSKSSETFTGIQDFNRGKEAGRAQARRQLRFMDICTGCGADAQERHHKDGNPTNNSPENLVGLCQICHQLAHGKRREFYAASWAWRNPA